MLPCHINAFLIKPGRVMGRKLRPLTLAHLWILEAIDSPYVSHSTRTFRDTVTASFIASHDPRLMRWLIMHPWAYKLAMRVWTYLYKGHDIKAAMDDFEAYWQAYTNMPTSWSSKGGSSRESCLPQSISMAWALIGRVGERRAWSMPLPLALSYIVAESEFNGAEYVTEDQKSRVSKETPING